MPSLTVAGSHTYFQMTGSGHPIVFVHGHALDSRLWETQMEGLSKLYTVIRYDLRGHGRSDAPATGYSLADYAQELFGVVEGLSLTKPSIVGHSMGGTIALEYALEHPTRCSSISLIGGGLEGYSYSEGSSETVVKQKELLRQEGVSEKFLRVALISPLYDGVRRDPERFALAKAMLGGWSGASWREERTYPVPQRLQIERLSELAVPALVTVGERDLPIFHEVADAICRGARVVRKATIPEAGHLAPMENPVAVNDILLDFIGGAAGKALL